MENQPNVFGEPVTTCCTSPMTGWYRNGCCETGGDDVGVHHLAHRAAAPGLVEAERVQAVVQVVAASDGREHLPHASGLLGVLMRVRLEARLAPGRFLCLGRDCGIGHGAMVGPVGGA